MRYSIILTSMFLLSISCQPSENINEIEPDYEFIYKKVKEIREQRGSIPLDLFVDEFSIESIDFSQHIGIQSTGIRNIAIKQNKDHLSITLFSNLDDFDGISIKAYPNIKGFYTEMTLSNGDSYSFDKDFVTGKDEFHHEFSSGRVKSFTSLNDELLEQYIDPLTVLYRVTSEVLFAVKELYYPFLGKKLPISYLESDTESHGNARILDSSCEVWPSIYLTETGWSNGASTRVLEGNLHAACSNQYCIGCCNIFIESECILSNTLCLVRGFGWQCDSFPGSGGGGCPVNRPCNAT